MPDREIDSAAQVRVCIYSAITEREQFHPHYYPPVERLKSISKNMLNRLRTNSTGRLVFDAHSYKVAHALGDNSNRGDMAIRMAVRAQLSAAFSPRQVDFIEVGWGRITDEIIEHVNRSADLFIIAGGGYIFVNGDGSPGAMLADSPNLSKLGCPVVALGIGLNRVMHETLCSLSELPRETRDKVKQLSEICRAISVRDLDTAELFSRYGKKPAAIIGDPVLYFSPDDRPTVARSGPLRIGVNLAAHGWRAFSILKPMLPRIIDQLKRIQDDRQADIVYFVHHDFERPIARFLQKKGLRMKIEEGTAGQLIEAYKGVDFVINQMLHSCIFAANAGVPFLNLAYDTKSVAFCALLGLPECAIEYSQVAAGLLAERIEQLLKNRDEISGKITSKRARLRSESRSFLDKVVLLAVERDESHGFAPP